MASVLPFKYGFVPVRWAQTVHTILEMDPDTPLITRLRIIELFDVQVNIPL